MSLQHDISELRRYCLERTSTSKNISKDVVDPGEIGERKLMSAKRAIIWLLTKSPHSVEELADHFEISPKLVSYLLKELVSEEVVSEVNKRKKKKRAFSDIEPKRYKLNKFQNI